MNAKPILTILLIRVLDKTVNFSVLPSEKHEKNENLEDRKNAMFTRKLKKVISCFQIDFFSLLFFSVFLQCYLCLYLCFLCFFYYFPFALLPVIGATKRQRAHINKASNINKILTMTSWRNQYMTPYWIFWKMI